MALSSVPMRFPPGLWQNWQCFHFEGDEMDVVRLLRSRGWLSAFFVAVLGLVLYCVFAIHSGVAPDGLNPLFWVTLAFLSGYIFFLCSLAKQLGENPLKWAMAVIILMPVGFLYTCPRMWF
jgi:hypothetical protein